MLENQKSQIF